jgi:hypothetical protein
MSDPTIDMNTRATRGAIPFILFFVLIIVIQIWREPILIRIAEIFGGSYETFEETEKFVSTAIMVLSGGLFSVLLFFTELNLHNTLDQLSFKVRKKTDKIIQNELSSAAALLGIDGSNEVLSHRGNSIRIFYHFTNNQDALRKRAFMLWGKYFLYLYVLTFGLVSFAITVLIAVLSKISFVSVILPSTILIFLAVYSLSVRKGLVPKIKELPKQQVEEIRIHNADELRREIEQRRPPTTGATQNG